MLKTLIDIFALAAVRSIIWLLANLPQRLAFKLAQLLVRIILKLIPRSHQVALRNLELVFPEKTPAERKQIAKSSYDVLAQNLLDFAQLPTLKNRLSDFEFAECQKTIDSLRSKNPGVGILAPTLHYGSFELIVQVQALFDKPAAVLARKFELPRLDRWWNKRRGLYGSEIFDRKGGYKEIIRRIKSGQDVAILFDQNVKANHAIFVPFFGISAATTKTVALAAMQTGCEVLFIIAARTRKEGKLGFEVIAKPIPSPDSFNGSRDEKMYAFIEAIHREAEAAIRAHPEQWFWIHRRFKTRPKGEKGLYS